MLFWIPKGKQAINRVIRRCLLCKRLVELSNSPPQQSHFPGFIVVLGRTFKSTGIDLWRSVFVTMHSKSKQMTKNYISITTYPISRVVHLEVLVDQSTEAYLRIQRGCIALRWVPTLMISNNGNTFKGRLWHPGGKACFSVS